MAHAAFKRIPGGADPNRTMQESFSLLDGFLDKSKELFGKGLEDNPEYPGILFILPLLATQDFFARPEEEVKQWFELFDVYVGESPVDQGVLLAAGFEIEPLLIEILAEMRDAGQGYRQ